MAFDWGGAGQGAFSGGTAGSAFGPWGTAIGAGIGGLTGGFGGGGRQDPTKQANNYLNQITGAAGGYYNPYINTGRKAGGILEGEYGKMLNPTSFIDEIMKHYNTSEGAKYERDELGRGIGATAAAGGFAGTPEHQKEYADMAHGVMSKDMQTYLQNALGVYGGGLSGQQDFYNKGFNASGSMADTMTGVLGSQAGLGYHGAEQHNEDRQALLNAISKALTQGGGSLSQSDLGAKLKQILGG